MEEQAVKKIVEGVNESLLLSIKEQVYEQTKLKDKEVSSLHREIRDDIKGLKSNVLDMKAKLDSHDKVIQEITLLYKTSGLIKKIIMWFIVFIPAVSAFIAGWIYIKDLFINKQ